MQPRRARRGRHEHHDGAYKAVKHTPIRARADALPRTFDNWPISADSLVIPITTLGGQIQIFCDSYCTVTVGLVTARM